MEWKVSRVAAVTLAVILLGIPIAAIFNELIGWSQVGRALFSGKTPPTTVPSLAGAALATVGYLRAHLGR